MAHPQLQHHQPQTLEEVRTLWIGDLQIWVDETYLHGCFAHTGEVSYYLSFSLFIQSMPFNVGGMVDAEIAVKVTPF